MHRDEENNNLHILIERANNIEEVLLMATSSIFANIKITDTINAERFIDAIEASANELKRVPSRQVNPPLTDSDAIRELMAKRIK